MTRQQFNQTSFNKGMKIIYNNKCIQHLNGKKFPVIGVNWKLGHIRIQIKDIEFSAGFEFCELIK